MMKNKPFFYFMLSVLTVFVFAGCAAIERDNPLDPEGTAYVAPATRVPILADDFNSYASAFPPPNPWQNSVTGAYGCLIMNIGAGPGNVIEFTPAGAVNDSYLTARTITVVGEFYVEYDIRINAAAQGHCKSCFQLLAPSGNSSFFEFGYSDKPAIVNQQFLYYNSGSGPQFPGNIAPLMGVWYRMKAKINLKHKKATVWYKPESGSYTILAENFDVPSLPDDITRIGFLGQILSAPPADNMQINNLEIYKIQ